MRIYSNKNKLSRIILCVIISIIGVSCETSNSSPNRDVHTEKNVVKNVSTISKNEKPFKRSCISIDYRENNPFETITSLLCGKKIDDGLKKTSDDFHWELYQDFIQISWKKLDKQRLSKIRTWRDKELALVDTLTHTVFYPFSGPDFLTVALMFPKADTFILLGLEPVGSLPDFNKMSAEQQQSYLGNFSNSLGDIFHKSYFITRKMLNDFQAQKVNGLLPVLCFFVQKLDYKIADIYYIYKDSTQQIKETPYFSKVNYKPFGMRIIAMKDSCAKNIYYYRYNVMDKFFNDSTAFYYHLAKHSHYITYIKSASYLLHNAFMKNMRDMILSNAVAILQDDTGIPYKFLKDTSQWTLKLYGEYDKPVRDFGKMGYQPELAKKMKEDSANISKLPFHLGYHWGNKKDVLMFALKK